VSLSHYHDLIARKRVSFEARGLSRVPALNAKMFPHQAHSTDFALRTGCAAMFLDTGLGKSLCALDWGRVIVEHTNRPVLMLAPLAVAMQHEREAAKFGIDAKAIREPEEIGGPRVYITNYDRLDRFDASQFGGVILDESSILKSFTGATTRKLISTFAQTPFRLACTATPAPNDHAELGQHSEFLGALSQSQMLVRWFLHDSADTGTWRMKGHAVEDFWNWVASWARCVSKPSDLGFSDDGFVLPEMTMVRHIVEADRSIHAGDEKDGQAKLFRMPETSATSIHREKRLTMNARLDKVYSVVTEDIDEWKMKRAAGLIARMQSTPNGAQIINLSGHGIAHPSKNPERQSAAIPQSDLKKASNTRSVSKAKTTTRSSGINLEPVPSAALQSPAGMAGSTSIIATPVEKSGGFYATDAMSGLGTSAIAPSFSTGPSATSLEEKMPAWVLWCETNDEQLALERMFGDLCISITGSMSSDLKESLHDAWLRGDRPILITKSSIFGYGLNWQHCCNMMFVSLSFSYESFYQAVRRCWRFGQTRPVNVHVAMADTEAAIWDVVSRKSGDHDAMKAEMVKAMSRASHSVREIEDYTPNKKATLPAWMAA